ncbi:flagellar hook-associated protein FlgL [Cupriavidus sp. WKF15]|uniref:flagellar hook-associated protein FlgL n=1 Tax=Cupriavidus sp. WKF15 TaxID=3032282 RepID=UPI0023E2EF2B|nr:flagellar hook-associated protein FlgL [Cupriavidus sp. WKF15]WER49793.1 flagellar hook-associated protein FlgL [Cupriavidus sp. WKF15]
MRVASSTLYQQGLASMNMQQSSLLHIQQQLGTGRKVLNPSDDPVAATRALTTSQASAVNGQYATSRKQANIALGMGENTLSTVTTVTQNIQTLLVQAGDGTLSDVDRASLATALQGQYDQLLGLANADDGNGQYLFGGTMSGSPPFVQGGGGVQYVGNTEQQQFQVDVARQMPAGSNGRAVFQSVQGSAGYVLKGSGNTNTGTANTGNATYGQVSTTDPTNPLYGTALTLSFDDSSGTMQYTIKDASGTAVGGTPLNYSEPAQIAVAGITFTVKGTPQSGDTISMQPASQAGTDMFANLKSVIDALSKPTPAAADSANLSNTIATGIRQFSNSLDNVLTVRASVGSRMQELDALDTIGTNRDLSYSATLSSVQDLDYAAAITEYYQRQTALQGAQQSFMQIQGMNLFKYL